MVDTSCLLTFVQPLLHKTVETYNRKISLTIVGNLAWISYQGIIDSRLQARIMHVIYTYWSGRFE